MSVPSLSPYFSASSDIPRGAPSRISQFRLLNRTSRFSTGVRTAAEATGSLPSLFFLSSPTARWLSSSARGPHRRPLSPAGPVSPFLPPSSSPSVLFREAPHAHRSPSGALRQSFLFRGWRLGRSQERPLRGIATTAPRGAFPPPRG